MLFNLNSQGNEEIKFFSLETYDFQTLGSETLIIAGYVEIEISIFQ